MDITLLYIIQYSDLFPVQVLLIHRMFNLGTLAQAVGSQHLSKEFVEKCVNIGLELVKTKDHPDVKDVPSVCSDLWPPW